MPGLATPLLGTAAIGEGGLTAAVDSYGDIVDVRVPTPAGRALLVVSAARQAAGSASAGSAVVPQVKVGAGPWRPLWTARWVRQRYLPDTNVVRTMAGFGAARVEIAYAARGGALACAARVRRGERGGGRAPAARGGAMRADFAGLPLIRAPRFPGHDSADPGSRRAFPAPSSTLRGAAPQRVLVELGGAARLGAAWLGCDSAASRRALAAATRADRRWIARARPLGAGAPGWARAMYARSLLALRALTDHCTGAVVAGARDGWAYVWPRDAAAVALAFAAAGYRQEARRVARFLTELDLEAAARFTGTGAPAPGRAAQGDAAGWVAAAARAAGLRRADRIVNRSRGAEAKGDPAPGVAAARAADIGTSAIASGAADRRLTPSGDGQEAGGARRLDWRGRSDYQEKSPGEYLANAIASGASAARIHDLFATPRGLAREAGGGLDSAAAWAVRPFPRPGLFPAVRRTLLRIGADTGRYGILPSIDWSGGVDPWTAPTAWTAWALAALAKRDRRAAIRPGSRGARQTASSRAAARPERRATSTGNANASDDEIAGPPITLARAERRAALRLMAALRRAATPLGLLPERVDTRSGVPRSTTPLAWSHAFAVLALRELWPASGPKDAVHGGGL